MARLQQPSLDTAFFTPSKRVCYDKSILNQFTVINGDQNYIILAKGKEYTIRSSVSSVLWKLHVLKSHNTRFANLRCLTWVWRKSSVPCPCSFCSPYAVFFNHSSWSNIKRVFTIVGLPCASYVAYLETLTEAYYWVLQSVLDASSFL